VAGVLLNAAANLASTLFAAVPCAVGDILVAAPSHHNTDISYILQVAPLSQRHRVAGWVSFNQKWKTGMGRQYFVENIGLSSTTMT